MLNKFKKFGRVLAAAFMLGGAALGTGCIEPDLAELSLSHHLYRVPAQGGEFELRVMSNDNWTALSDSPEWLNVQTTQGRGSINTLVIVDMYNGVESSRTGHITFRLTGSDPMIQTVTVTQTKFGSELMISPQEYTIGAQGGDVSIAVTSNIKWKVTNSCEWATYEPATGEGVGTIVITVQPNKTGEPRTTTFTVSDNGSAASDLASEKFELTQKANPDPIVIMDKNVHFTATLSGVNVPYKMPVVGVNFNMEAPSVYSNDTWLLPVTVEQTDGIWFVKFTPQVNNEYEARSGIISVIIRDPNREDAVIMEQIIVTQDGKAGPVFTLFPDRVDFPAEGGSSTAEYSTNVTDIRVAGWPEWLTAKPTIDLATKVISFSATPNVDAESREGDIEVVAVVGDNKDAIKRKITINQAGVGEFTYFVLPKTKNIIAAGDEFTAVVYSTNPDLVEPTVVTSASWLTSQVVASTSPVGEQGKEWMITFAADANEDAEARTATVYVLSRANGLVDYYRTISVIQNGVGGPQIEVAPSFVTIANSDEATAQLALLGAKNAEIACLMSDSWVGAEVSEDKTTITLTASANQGAETRTATLFVTATQGGKTQTVRVEILQPGNGGAEIDVPKNLYFIDATEQELEIPALALNGSKAALSSWTPELMFTEEPALETADALEKVTVKITANDTFEARVAEIILLATNGDSRPQFYAITIVQKGNVPYTVPEATVTPDNVVFEADAFSNEAAQDVIIYNSEASFTYTVTTPEWLDASDMSEAVADANGKLTMTLTPNKDNLTATPFVGVVTLLVHNGTKTQEISIPVAMKASLTPIYPSAYSVAFPAESFGEEMAALVNLVGYDANYEIASVVTRNNWFTVSDNDTDGLLTIYPNTPLAGPNVQARTGEIDVVVTAVNDPAYRVAFTITVVQETADAANVAYAPAFHTVGVRGNVEKYLDETGAVIDPTGDKVETWFANPDGLTLEVVSGLDQGFVSKATWISAPADEMSVLSLEVQTNKSSATARVTVVNVVARNVWGNVVGHFPITVMQSGVADPAIDLVAAFVDAAVVLKYASGADNTDDPTEHTVHYEVDAYLNLADGIEVFDVQIVELDGKTEFPAPGVERPEPITDGIGWIKVQQPPFTANDPDADPTKYCGWINYEIIDGPGSGFPTVTGEYVSARVKVTLRDNKREYVIYQLVTVVAPEIPEIGASLVTNEDTIKSGVTDYTIAFANDMGENHPVAPGTAEDDHYVAVIQPIDPATDIQYASGSEGWLAEAEFDIVVNSPESTIEITGIPTNESDNPRVAAITITLKADNHQDQKITFVLHQEAWPTIGATLAAYEGWITAIATDTEAAVNTLPIPVGTAGIVFANDQGATAVGFDYVYTDDSDPENNPLTWLEGTTFMEEGINIEGIAKNDDQETSIDRHADIHINLEKTADVDGYPTVFKPETLTYKLTQRALLEIGASLVDDKGTITALETSTADADTPIAFADDKGATVAGFDKAYVGTATGWMEETAFVEDDINVEGIDKNNSQEPPYADRHAIITINLTKEGYKNQKLTYELTQLAMESIGAEMANAKGTIEANVAAPEAEDYTNVGPIVIANDRDSEYAFAVEYPDGGDAWLNTEYFTPTGDNVSREVVITGIAPNDTPVDRYAIITITLTHEDYQPQVFTYTLTQLAQPTIGATLRPDLQDQGAIDAIETTTGDLLTFANDQGATIGLTPVITYIEDYPGTEHTWLNEATFSVTGETPNQTLVISNIPENDDDLDRHAKIAITLTKEGYQDQVVEFILTQHLKPAIEASLVTYSGIIEAIETTDVIEFNDDKEATIAVSVADIQYQEADVAGWLAGATFTPGGTSPKSTINITGIDQNPSTEDRHARIAIVLTKANHRTQTIYYTLTQRGIPEINAAYNDLYVVNEDDPNTATSFTVTPVANPNGGAITGAITLDFGGEEAWVTATPGATPGSVNFAFTPFFAENSKFAVVSFTLTRAGYYNQEVSFTVEQWPAEDQDPNDPNLQLIRIINAELMPWQAGSTSLVTYEDLNYNGTPATVAVEMPLSNALTSVVVGPNAGEVTVTGALDNETGQILMRTFTLIATNYTPGGQLITKRYEVDVPQTFAPAGVLQGITMNQSGSNHFTNLVVTMTGTTINISHDQATPNSHLQLDLAFLPGANPTVALQEQQLGTPPVLDELTYNTAGYIYVEPVANVSGVATFDIEVTFGANRQVYNVIYTIN